MTKKKFLHRPSLVKYVRQAIRGVNTNRPFSKGDKGDPKKDYYRGQWDALVWVLGELLSEEV